MGQCIARRTHGSTPLLVNYVQDTLVHWSVVASSAAQLVSSVEVPLVFPIEVPLVSLAEVMFGSWVEVPLVSPVEVLLSPSPPGRPTVAMWRFLTLFVVHYHSG